MDIRNFFGGKKSGSQESSGTSALSAVRKAAPATPEKNKRSEKLIPNKSEQKTRKLKKAAVPVVELSESDDSDGESPIPASLRKEAMKQKRSRALVISDSDEEFIPKKGRIKSVTPSPVKSPPQKAKRSRIVVSDSDEEKEVTPKKQKTKTKPQEATPKKHETKAKPQTRGHESGDDEVTSETDSEDEFKEKKKPKKGSSAAQKKPGHDKDLKKASPTKGKKSDEKLERVSAKEVFGSSGADEKTALKKKGAPSKTTKISPSQKENDVERKHEKPKKKIEEINLDDDESPVSHKSGKHATPYKDVSKKASELDKKSSEQTPQKSQKAKVPLKDHDKKSTAKGSAPVQAKPVKGEVFVPWVDKYKPRNLSQLVGQHGEKSPMNKLLGWLKDWARNNLGEGGKIKKPKPPPFLAQTDGAPFKAVLLSGSPGVGKTTCAVMACDTLGLKMVEMNASDVRSKKNLEQQITQLTESHQIEEYFANGESGNDNEVKHVLIMDEVDGMSGTEDRAGIAELIQIIKETKIPIICICNDRQHPKIRSLANYCFDVRFQKPRVEQIRARMMSIACQEKLKISKEELDQMIELSGHDVRQTIYNMQLHSSSGGQTKVQKKDVAVGPFEAARKLLDSRSTLQEKQDTFFVDYSIMPLFVQENYPNMRNDKHTPKQAMAGLRKAADLISHGDTIERCIRSTGTWKLLNEQAMLACALPAIATDGHLRAMIQFPAWLGKNSTANKRQRLLRQLATHMHLKISADNHSLVADYVPVLRDCLTKPLLERETDGVFEVVCTMNDYDLIREDAEAVSELAVWPGKIDPASKILPKVKAALTRSLNKEYRTLPYATDDIGKSRRKAQQVDYEVELDEEGNLIEKFDGEESGFEDDSEDEDYKPGSKSKAKAKPAPAASRGRGRGGSTGATPRGGGGTKRGRGK
uniref:Replication factor C subunit 1 n=1 Tax=Haemonchus contortus TaxID=6289 RepID=A0A7I4YSS2_HAECO